MADINDVLTQLTELEKSVKSLIATVKVLKKQKPAKKPKKEVDPDAPKKLNGFNKPIKVSNTLCDFMGISHGAEVSRTDVTPKISAYINEKELKNPEKKTDIILDAKLSKLLGIKQGDAIRFPQIQTYLKPHYPRPASAGVN